MSGRLTKWAIELGEFDIKFMPRTTIKRKAVVDFVAEFTYPTKTIRHKTDKPSTSETPSVDDEPINPSNIWSLRINGSSNVNGSGAGVVLESPDGRKSLLRSKTSIPCIK